MKPEIVKYMNTMHQAKLMLNKGIITTNDYAKIEKQMAKKYNLKNSSLYRQNHLINN